MTSLPKNPKRYISLWLPKWSVESRIGKFVSGPLVQTFRNQNRIIIQALNNAAEQAGLQKGMTLATARAICADLIVENYQPDHCQRSLERLADWATRFTPYVALDGADGLMLDATGCPHLFGDETGMINAISDQLTDLDHLHRLALTDTPAASWGLARFANKPWIIQTGRVKELVQGLPVESLRLSPGIVGDLHRVGLRRIKDILNIPRASLASRYGMEVATRLDQMLGHIGEAITPRLYEAPFSTRLAFPDAIGLRGDIDAALERLITVLTDKLEAKAMGTRQVVLVAEKVDKTFQYLTIGISEASASPKHLTRLFQEKMDQIAPGFGIDTMRLIATRVEVLKRTQMPMLSGKTSEATGDKLALLIDSLKNRLGSQAVGRICPKDSHLPDHTQGWNTQMHDVASGDRWSRTPPRPSLLLKRPKPLQILSKPGDSKAPKIIIGHRDTQVIAKTWGPERISPDWWRKDTNWVKGPRDYYRVEMEGGEQLWIYRESQSRERLWFLHGRFA